MKASSYFYIHYDTPLITVNTTFTQGPDTHCLIQSSMLPRIKLGIICRRYCDVEALLRCKAFIKITYYACHLYVFVYLCLSVDIIIKKFFWKEKVLTAWKGSVFGLAFTYLLSSLQWVGYVLKVWPPVFEILYTYARIYI